MVEKIPDSFENISLEEKKEKVISFLEREISDLELTLEGSKKSLKYALAGKEDIIESVYEYSLRKDKERAETKKFVDEYNAKYRN